MRIETERQRRIFQIFALDPRLVCSPPQSIIIPRHAARDPSAKSPHFKFSFPDCAPQFESDMPPYSRAPCRYILIHASTYTTGCPIDSRARKEQTSLCVVQNVQSQNLSRLSLWCNTVCDGVVPFSRVAYLSGPPPFRPVGVECAKRETQ